MILSEQQFKADYIAAANESGLPSPSETTIVADYEAYRYGASLVAGEASVRFFKEGGKLTWDVGPAPAG